MSGTRLSPGLSRLQNEFQQRLCRKVTISSPAQRRASTFGTSTELYTQKPSIRSLTQADIRYRSRHVLRSVQAHRSFSATSSAAHGHITPPKAGEELYVTFVDKDGDEHRIAVAKGDNLLDVAQAHDIEMEGACGGSCACSTCHVIVEDGDLYDKMPEPDDDENDMLDLAFGLTETSRLGCQVVMDESLNEMRVKLPSMTRNLQASDFSKKNERSD